MRAIVHWCFSFLIVFLFAWTGAGVSSLATDRYVALDGGHDTAGGYTNWAGAATNIQDAIDVAAAGETVWVSNGVYAVGGVTNFPTGTVLTNRVAVWKAITVRSANNDPTNTIIKGTWDPATNGPAAVRCVYMTNGSSLIGFTLTNGATLTTGGNDSSGGGVWCLSINAIISNCVIVGNSALDFGGGAYQGALYNCTIVSNSAVNYGGGASGGTLYNCTLTGNSAVGFGGGAYGATLFNCTLTGNFARDYGGGVSGGTLYNCMLTGNSVPNGGGGGAYGATLYNCTMTSNSTGWVGGGVRSCQTYNCMIAGNSAIYGGGAYESTLYNCTIVGNSAAAGDGVYGGAYYNSIIYFNDLSSSGSNWDGAVSFTNSCTAPAQGGWAAGNITNDPTFIANGEGYGTNHVAGNYRLRSGSPCINTATNFPWMSDPNDVRSKDLDENPRLDKFSGLPDMGCYEHVPPPSGTVFSTR